MEGSNKLVVVVGMRGFGWSGTMVSSCLDTLGRAQLHIIALLLCQREWAIRHNINRRTNAATQPTQLARPKIACKV